MRPIWTILSLSLLFNLNIIWSQTTLRPVGTIQDYRFDPGRFVRINSSSYSVPAKEWTNLLFKGDQPFYETQYLFHKYWANKEGNTGDGWKPFKRLEHHWLPRLNEDGKIPDPMNLVLELQTELRRGNARNANSSNTWIPLGPNSEPDYNNGVGRINIVAFHPTNAHKLFAGSPSGGLWTSDNGGQSWYTITNGFQNLGVSDITFDPVDPNIIYIATGDRDGYDTGSYGLLISTDGGQNWNLTSFRPNYSNVPYFSLIDRILIDPSNRNKILVSTTSGIFRSIDRGQTWSQVLSGVRIRHMEFNPSNSSIVYASMDDYNPDGNNSAFYRSTNGGANWTLIALPNQSVVERFAIGTTPSNGSIVYLLASYDGTTNDFYALYKSTNSGLSFSQVNVSIVPELNTQEWYDWTITVSPSNPNIL